MDRYRFLAFDLGAESGRAVVGTLKGGRLVLEEICRFANEPVRVCDTLHWDVLALYNNVLKAMRQYRGRFGERVDGIGIDTWSVDFGLLARDGTLLQNPVHYRDGRTRGIAEKLRRSMSAEQLFQRTGMSPFPFSTLCQLLSLRLSQSPVLECAATLLMMPDLFAYFLTGEKRCERTVAVSSQLYDPRTGWWHEEIFKTFDLPLPVMPELVDPGTVLGELRQTLERETGLKRCAVIAPCTHDTASAVAAVPSTGEGWAFLSSGTWSVLGALTEELVTSSEAFSAGMCNELTQQGPFLCRNIMGLWLVQQARAAWKRGGESYSYGELVRLAEQAAQDGPLVHPDAPCFLAPDDMPQAVREYCIRTGQRAPRGPAETVRCILESLALSYRHGLEQLAHVLRRSFRSLHLVGGGSLNALLCRLTADSTGVPVVAGPAEATVAGNVLVQALARGYLSSPQEIRDVVRESSALAEYEPHDTSRWEDRYAQYLRLLERTED